MNSAWQITCNLRIRQLASQLINNHPWKYRIRPITWWNVPSWVKQTIKQDRRFYRIRPRPPSVSRVRHFISPNLSNPIFIVGAPRSGTTFLGQCISELPQLSYHFEPVLTKAAVRYIYTQQWSPKKAQHFYRQVYTGLMRLYLDGDLCFCEKTPRNSFILPFLYQTFPDARFVHIIRDGRDVALSLSQQPWYRNDRQGSSEKEPGGYPFGPSARFWVEPNRTREFETTNDLHRCIWLWRCYVESARSGSGAIPPSQYYELRYEDLVQEPGREATRLLDFLNITVESSQIAFKQAVVTKARQNSIGQWRQNISSRTLNQMYAESGQLLECLGYTAVDINEPLIPDS